MPSAPTRKAAPRGVRSEGGFLPRMDGAGKGACRHRTPSRRQSTPWTGRKGCACTMPIFRRTTSLAGSTPHRSTRTDCAYTAMPSHRDNKRMEGVFVRSFEGVFEAVKSYGFVHTSSDDVWIPERLVKEHALTTLARVKGQTVASFRKKKGSNDGGWTQEPRILEVVLPSHRGGLQGDRGRSQNCAWRLRFCLRRVLYTAKAGC